MEKIQKILSFAMRMEEDAGNFYSHYMDSVKSESTKDLFRELVKMEKHHYSVLRETFERMGFSDPPISASWVVDNAFAAKDPHILADASDTIQSAEDEVADLAIIRMAYLIENEFYLFYKNAIEAVDDAETKKLLSDLSDWEKGHRDIFYKKYQELLRKYWGDVESIIFAQ